MVWLPWDARLLIGYSCPVARHSGWWHMGSIMHWNSRKPAPKGMADTSPWSHRACNGSDSHCARTPVGQQSADHKTEWSRTKKGNRQWLLTHQLGHYRSRKLSRNGIAGSTALQARWQSCADTWGRRWAVERAVCRGCFCSEWLLLLCLAIASGIQALQVHVLMCMMHKI